MLETSSFSSSCVTTCKNHKTTKNTTCSPLPHPSIHKTKDDHSSYSCNVLTILHSAAQESRNDLEHLRHVLHNTLCKTYTEGISIPGLKKPSRRKRSWGDQEAYYAQRWRGHLPLAPYSSGIGQGVQREQEQDAVRVDSEWVRSLFHDNDSWWIHVVTILHHLGSCS